MKCEPENILLMDKLGLLNKRGVIAAVAGAGAGLFA